MRISTRFWNAFGPDWRKNCLAWQRAPHNPVLPPSGETWKRRWTANPDFLHRPEDGALVVYYRGNGILPGRTERNQDRLAVAQVDAVSPQGVAFHDRNAGGAPIVDVGAPGDFDDSDVLDPAAVRFRDHVFLYYSAIGAGDDSIGLAVSSDGLRGETFEKRGKVLTGRAPDAVVHDDRLYLLSQDWLPGDSARQRYAFSLFVSDDGYRFDPAAHETPILTGTAGDWDGFSVVTGRLFAGAEGWFYLLYGGSAYRSDEPEHFGLARSRDLIHWEKHPGNPIFGAGRRGDPDGAAIWFPALWETETHFLLLYEGSSGPYSWQLHSSICLASLAKP